MKRSALCFVLVLAVPVLFGAAPASAQAATPALEQACLVALDACSLSCTGLDDPASTASCRARCEKAATTCFGDEPPTLSSEEYLAYWGENVLSTKASACHDTTPCPPEYGSCGSWSSFSDCGDQFCGISTQCKVCNEWGQCTAGGPALKQNRERYRVCFNAQMQGCTEYQRSVQTFGCGC